MSRFENRLRRLEEAAGVSADSVEALLKSLSSAELKALLLEDHDWFYREFKSKDPDLARRFGNLADWTEIQIKRLPEEQRPAPKRMAEIKKKRERAEYADPHRAEQRLDRLDETIIKISDEAAFELAYLDYFEALDPPSIRECLLAGQLLEFQHEGKPLIFGYATPPRRDFISLVVKEQGFADRQYTIHVAPGRPDDSHGIWKKCCQRAFYAANGWPHEYLRMPQSWLSVVAAPASKANGSSPPPQASKPAGYLNAAVKR